MEIAIVIVLALMFLVFLSQLTGDQTAEDKPTAPVQVIIQQAAEQTGEGGSAVLIMFVVAFLVLVIIAMMQAP